MKKQVKRMVSFVLSMTMVFSLTGAPVLAGEHIHSDERGYSEESLCTHVVHDAECGYVESVEAGTCTHVHEESCGYAPVQETVPCGHSCSSEGCPMKADGSGKYDCQHTSHSAECGYQAAFPGNPCSHVHDANCSYTEAAEGSPCKHGQGVHDTTCGDITSTKSDFRETKKTDGDQVSVDEDQSFIGEKTHTISEETDISSGEKSDPMLRVTGWLLEDGIWYYYDKNGDRVKGAWKKSGNQYFYLDPDDGHMVTNKLIHSDGYCFYVGENGARVINQWIELPNSGDIAVDNGAKTLWFYFKNDGRSTQAMDGSAYISAMIDSKMYFFDSKGRRLWGVLPMEDGSGGFYYLGDSDDGVRKEGWQWIPGEAFPQVLGEREDSWYYFSNNGRAERGDTGSVKKVKIGFYYYFFDSMGRRLWGVLPVEDGSGDFYYLGDSPDSGWMKTGWEWIPGDAFTSTFGEREDGRYFFDNDGKSVRGSVGSVTKIEYGGKVYGVDAEGRAYSGWVAEDGTRCQGEEGYQSGSYYFVPEDFDKMLSNAWLELNGKRFYFDADGRKLHSASEGEFYYRLIDQETWSFDYYGVALKSEETTSLPVILQCYPFGMEGDSFLYAEEEARSVTVGATKVRVVYHSYPRQITVTSSFPDGSTSDIRYYVKGILANGQTSPVKYIDIPAYPGENGEGIDEWEQQWGSGIIVVYEPKDEAVLLKDIAITAEPTKTVYTEGEKFDPAGMVVEAFYTNGTAAPVTTYTILDGDSLKEGQTKVTITYTQGGVNRTALQPVTVNAGEGQPHPELKKEIPNIQAVTNDFVTQAEHTVTVLEGSGVTLTANMPVTASPYKLQWSKKLAGETEFQPIEGATGTQLIIDAGKLTLANSEQYICTAIYEDMDSRESEPLTVTVKEREKFTVVVNPDGRIYEGKIDIRFALDRWGVLHDGDNIVYYYTTDGTYPTMESERVEGQAGGSSAKITVTENSMVKVFAMLPDKVTTPVTEFTINPDMIYVAKVTTGHETAYYNDFMDAWGAAMGKTAAITLLKDVSLTDTILTVPEGTDILWEGGIYALTGTYTQNSPFAFIDILGGSFTLVEGTLTVGPDFSSDQTNCVRVNSGRYTQKGGTVHINGHSGTAISILGGSVAISGGNITGNAGVEISNANAELEITGGTVYANNTGLYVSGYKRMELSGGVFKGSGSELQGAIHVSSESYWKDILKEGFAYYQGEASDVSMETMITDIQGNVLTGTVAVARKIETISVDITWGSLEYTYENGTWDPETYTYESRGWKPDSTQTGADDKPGTITVTNNSTRKMGVSYSFENKGCTNLENLTGSFALDSAAGMAVTTQQTLGTAEADKTQTVYLNLQSDKPKSVLEKETIGTVTVVLRAVE